MKLFTLHFKQYLGRRRQRMKNNGIEQEESKDLTQATATETPTTVKERTSLSNKASNFLRALQQW